MKKIIYFLILLVCGLSSAKAQQTVSIYAQNIPCFNPLSGANGVAYLTSTVSGAAGYTWNISGGSGGQCSPILNQAANGFSASIYYKCCGNYTITAAAYNGSFQVISSASTVIAVACSSLNVAASSTAICSGQSVQLAASGASSYTWTNSSGFPISYSASAVVSPTVSSCYTVSAISNGCFQQRFVCINVSQSPLVVVSGPSSACMGDTITLTAMGANTYTWSNGLTASSIMVMPFSSTCYSVVGSNTSGCTDMAVHCVTVNSSPVISGPSYVCQNNQVTLYAPFGSASNYTWYPGGSTFTSIVVSPTATTCYTLVSSGNCSAPAVHCVSVAPNPQIGITVSPGCTNTRTLTASGGSFYSWSTGQSGGSIVVSPSVTTCYSVTTSNSFSCSASTFTCLSVQFGGFSVAGPSVLCNGNSGTLSVNQPGSYTWSPGTFTGTSIVITPTVSTCYTVTGTFSNGCTQTLVKCVNVGQTPTITTSPNQLCPLTSGTLSASGASSYQWLPWNMFGSSIVITPTVSSCYTVIGTSSAGCQGSAIGCYSVLPSPTITVSGNSVTCAGTSVTLTASGGNSYLWQPGNLSGATVVVTPTSSTCYTVTGFGSSCSAKAVKCITAQSGNLNIAGPQIVCAGNSSTLNAAGATSYTWLPGNSPFPLITITPTANTCYTVLGTYTNGCQGKATRCVSVLSQPTISTSSGIFCAGHSGVLSATGANNYTWYPYNMTGSNITISPTVSTCYTVVGTTSAGCSNSATGCFSVLPSPTVSIAGNNVLCPGNSTTLTASGASSYTWLPIGVTGSSVVVSPSTSVCYTVIGNNGACSASAIRCVTVQNTNVTVSGPTYICAGSTATLIASGASGYTWQPGNLSGTSIFVSPSVSTCYTVTGSSSAGTCVASAVKCFSVISLPQITTSAPVFCSGVSGIITASGAATYSWVPFNLTGSSVLITPTTSGCYTVSGANGFGCRNSATGCYSVKPVPSLTVSGNVFLCYGDTALLTASGANNYTWIPGNMTGASTVISPTANTCYTVVGTLNGCISGVVKCVNVQTSTLQITGPNVVCANNSATLTASGAVNYVWQPGNLSGASIVISPTAATCYTVTGTSPNGSCTSTAFKCVSVAPALTMSTSGGPFCAGQNGTLTATGASSYTWYPFNATGQTIVVSPTVSGCYTVVGSSSGGCSGSAVGCYSVMPVPSINVSGSSSICAGNSTTLTATGATSYTWLPGFITGPGIVVSPSVTTCYTVQGSVGSCIGTGLRCVSVQQTSLGVSGPSALCGVNGATLTASGASNYTWQPGNLTGASIYINPTSSTCYTVIGYSGSNCMSSAVKCVSVVPGMTLTISGTRTICAGQLANISVSGASTYSWSNGSSGSSIFVSPPFSTTYFVTGFIGSCSTSTSVPVTVNPLPVVSVASSQSFVCAGNPVSLIANGAGNYTWSWSTGQNANVITVTPTASTVYTVTGTSPQGCSRSVTIAVNVFGNCTGIEDADAASTATSLYPNPSNGEVRMSSNSGGRVNYLIYDMLGREVLNGYFAGTRTLDLSTYHNGTYIVRFESKGGVSYQRLVINK